MSTSWPGTPPFPVGAQLHIEDQDGTILLRGELDAATSRLLETEVDRLIEDGERAVVIDFTEVTFVSASAMEFLVGLAGRLGDLIGWLELRHPTGTVRQLLHVCGLTRFMRHGDW